MWLAGDAGWDVPESMTGSRVKVVPLVGQSLPHY